MSFIPYYQVRSLPIKLNSQYLSNGPIYRFELTLEDEIFGLMLVSYLNDFNHSEHLWGKLHDLTHTVTLSNETVLLQVLPVLFYNVAILLHRNKHSACVDKFKKKWSFKLMTLRIACWRYSNSIEYVVTILSYNLSSLCVMHGDPQRTRWTGRVLPFVFFEWFFLFVVTAHVYVPDIT